MEISFVKTNAAAEAPAIDVQATVKPADTISVPVAADVAPVAAIPTAPVANLALAPATAPRAIATNPTQLDDDNIGFEDVILPRINIVQKVGDLSNIFNGGEVVLNQQVVIHTPACEKEKSPGTGLLNITVLGFRPRQFTEKVAGGKLGLLVNSEADVAKNGGTLDYKEWQASELASKQPGGAAALRRFEKLATALLLVERPEFLKDEDHVLFPYDFEGKYYALALWSMKGVSYTNAAKHMFTARKIGHLRTGYTAQAWSLTTALEQYDKNFAYKPIIKPAAKNSDAFRQFCKDILGAGN